MVKFLWIKVVAFHNKYTSTKQPQWLFFFQSLCILILPSDSTRHSHGFRVVLVPATEKCFSRGMEILIVSKLTSASSSSSEDSEDCSGFVEVAPYELPLKTWVIDPVEEDE